VILAFIFYPIIFKDDRTKHVVIDNLPLLGKGAIITVIISVCSIFYGIGIGVLVGVMRVSKNPVLRALSTVYVEIIRGTPLLVQIFIWYFFPSELLGWNWPRGDVGPIIAGVLALGTHSSAYQAEIFRGAIQSIPRGQFDAAKSLGMRNAQVMLHVILPQAFRNAIPPLGNEFIIVLKDSSLLNVITVVELTRNGQYIIGTTFIVMPVYLTIALMYLVLTFTISRILRFVETKTKIPGLGAD
jgi:polar amino acid transport system permease protein